MSRADIVERPILFKPDMVRAVLDDAAPKTATRRPVAALRGLGRITEFQRSDTPGYDWTFRDGRMLWNDLRHADVLRRCPHGVPGERLWVRETWDFRGWEEQGSRRQVMLCYGADAAQRLATAPEDWQPTIYGHERWRSPIHIPRWASRILLEITDVQLQQVQAIAEAEAMAEGAQWRDLTCRQSGVPLSGWSMLRPHPLRAAACEATAQLAFAGYINMIHGGPRWYCKPSNLWLQNPWLWVISFRRVKP